MRRVAEPYRSDPTWYRIGYSLAAQRLHAATAGGDRFRGDDFGRETAGILSRLEGIQAEVDELPTFAAAERDARALAVATAATLRSSGWGWVRRRPAWFVRLWGHRGPAADRKLASFLSKVVEPAAVVLVHSARAGEGSAPKVRRSPDPSWALSRAELAGGEKHQDWFDRYLGELLGEDEIKRSRWLDLLAWLGSTKHRRPEPVNYRVRYNLACLFSRFVRSSEDRDQIQIALGQLYLCLKAVDPRKRAQLVRWAWQDPGLNGLRNNAQGAFAELVGPNPRFG